MSEATQVKTLKRQVLLNETEALPVADINMTIDGRYITEAQFNEMVETFDPNNIKVGWYIGHIFNFWMEKDKEPEKQGIIRDVKYDDGVLYVYSQDLNPEFLELIEQGKYTDLSIETMRMPIDDFIVNDDGEKEQVYKWHITGIAAVKTGAFSRYGLVEFQEYSIEGKNYKIINKSNFFGNTEKKEVKMAKQNKKVKSDETVNSVIVDNVTEPEITTTMTVEDTKDNELSIYVDNLQKQELATKEENEFLKSQIKLLKTKIETKNSEIDELKLNLSNKDDESLKKDFKIFYLTGQKQEKLHNKFMKFDDDVDILKIKLDDIYKSQMWRDYSSNNDLRKSIEVQLDRGFFIEKMNNTQYGNRPAERGQKFSKNYTDDELYEYAKKLAIKETGFFKSEELSKYLKKAEQEIAKNNY